MFQTTRQRLALWYTGVTAVLLLLFATGFYLYVRNTLVERIDDTLNHVVEVVQRSLVVESISSEATHSEANTDFFAKPSVIDHRVNLEASFPDHAAAVEDDHIDLEWFSPAGELLWSTFSAPLDVPLDFNSSGKTVYANLYADDQSDDDNLLELPVNFALRQITQRVQLNDQTLGYLRVSHPWFEVTKPSRQLIRDLSVGVVLVLGAVAAIGWLLSGLAIAPIRDSYQRLKQFTADASHELRNPIAVIQTNVQVALADPDPSLQQDQLRVVERLTRRLGRLVDDLLFLARQDSITPLQVSSVLLDKLLQDVVEEQQAIADDKGVMVAFQISESAEAGSEKKQSSAFNFAVNGDADQLTRLFTNLISNAVQYTSKGGSVRVSLQRVKIAGGFLLQVQVQDTGIGIPTEAIPHLFDRFYRVDPARSSLSGAQQSSSYQLAQSKRSDRAGSGLGLAIAKVIVDNHQGQIQVNSVLHQGTTFTVLLPCLKSAA
ncbi:MAG: sensor histidine kinase [Cyanobacteria bacterium RM1_2_2]|nr:sensor histidine kinase [Cyanobacteria bacterium RM1_2_2]